MHLNSRQRRRALVGPGAGLLCLLGLAGCAGSPETPAAAGSVAVVSPTATGASAAVAVEAMELTKDGFAPDRLEAKQGTRLTLRNATDSKQSVVVKGRDVGGGDGETITLEAGQTLDLSVYQTGAYVLTLASDPQVTASIFIS